VFHVSSSKHHVSISAVAQKVNLGNLGVRNAMRPNERARCRFWASCDVRLSAIVGENVNFAVVVRYAIVTLGMSSAKPETSLTFIWGNRLHSALQIHLSRRILPISDQFNEIDHKESMDT